MYDSRSVVGAEEKELSVLLVVAAHGKEGSGWDKGTRSKRKQEKEKEETERKKKKTEERKYNRHSDGSTRATTRLTHLSTPSPETRRA